MAGPLANIRHERFCREIISGKSQVEAYRLAGYECAQRSLEANAHRLMENDGVKKRIAELGKPIHDKYAVTNDRITRELALLGFARLKDYSKLMESGSLDDVTSEESAAISELLVETTVSGKGDDATPTRRVKLKLSDKRQALVELGKLQGMFKDGADLNVPVTFIIERTERSKGK